MDENSIFIEKHMGLIIDAAWKHFKSWMIYEEEIKKQELIHEGMLGLIRAREKFDKELGYQFSTYAHRWIWGKMSRYIHNQQKKEAAENNIYIHKKNIVLERSKEEREFIDIASVKSEEGSIDLLDFIESLDDSNKKICNMLIQGYKQKEIANMLNIQLGSMNQRISSLRKIIQEEYLKCS